MAKFTQNKVVNFPNSSAEFNKFFNSFGKKLNSNSKTFNFTPSQMRQFKSVFNTWNKQWTAFQKAQTAYLRAQATMQTSQNSANSLVTKFWTKIANSPKNNGQFSTFGIPSNSKTKTVKRATVKKTTRTIAKKSPVSTRTSSAPTMRINTSTRGKNVIYVSPSGNSKWPTNAVGAVIQYRKNNGSWYTLTTTNEFPFTHVIGSNFNGSFQYRAAYSFGGKQFGPWSKINKIAIKKAA